MPRPPERTAEPRIPAHPTLLSLREAAAECTACDLWRRATQTVFGEGRKKSTIMLVGEQPGNSEDLEGRPFVGPAGALLDRALEEAGIERSAVYVTNVVKHFKWEPRGKTRIHKKPNASEIAACRPWLQAEVAIVKPTAIICLGATAAHAVIGPKFKVTTGRGTLVDSSLAPIVSATIHPSAILRAPTAAQRQSETERFIADLTAIRREVEGLVKG
jgi:uracil-DNA glycosylase family protein